MTFTDFINTYRLQSAANLLENSSLKIIEIALECGFKSVRAFNDAFKKQLCCTPSEYRKKINSH
jgi:AraC-like DNA-binding protein